MNVDAPLLSTFGMYDDGEFADANDALWANLAARLSGRGIDHVPPHLSRDRALGELWASPRLLFGQACGYPFATLLRHRTTFLGAPVYDVPGCVGASHKSFVIVEATSKATSLSDLRGARIVVNEATSNTGRHLLGDALAQVGATPSFFSELRSSGSHRASLSLVASKEADVAAIDCISYAYQKRAAPHLTARTRILHQTRATPSPPFIVSSACGDRVVRLVSEALSETLADPKTRDARAILRLLGIQRLPVAAYDVTQSIAESADRVFGSFGLPQECKSESNS
jgi:ABC-type phosphate/phosphonate transport system substrate-binding protein